MIDRTPLTSHFNGIRPFPHRFILRETTPQNVAIIRIHHSHGANILSPAVLFQLNQAVDDAISDPAIRGIVVTASEPGFIFGAEIPFFIRHIERNDLEPIHTFTRIGNDCFDRIASSSKPIVAAINGPAFGGGLELALACHTRVAVPGATMSLPEVGIGLCPLWGGILRLKRLIGTETAKRVVYTGKNTSVKEALEMGMVDCVVDRDNMMKTAIEMSLMPLKEPQYRNNSVINDPFLQLMKTTPIESLFRLTSLDIFDKKTQNSIKQVCNKSYLALKYCEMIFGWNEKISVDQRDRSYYEIVEHLYRSEDTITGLKWKLEKKIGLPIFAPKSKVI